MARRRSAATMSPLPAVLTSNAIQNRREGMWRVNIQVKSPTNSGAILLRNVAFPAEVCITAVFQNPTSPAKRAPPRTVIQNERRDRRRLLSRKKGKIAHSTTLAMSVR